jgi:hypothetical protein
VLGQVRPSDVARAPEHNLTYISTALFRRAVAVLGNGDKWNPVG